MTYITEHKHFGRNFFLFLSFLALLTLSGCGGGSGSSSRSETPATIESQDTSFYESTSTPNTFTGTAKYKFPQSTFSLPTGNVLLQTTSIASGSYRIVTPLPASLNLIAKISATTSNLIEITVTGNASDHSASNSLQNGLLGFEPSLFSTGRPDDLSARFAIIFHDPSTLQYWDTTFRESPTVYGDVVGKAFYRFNHTTLSVATGGSLTQGTHFSIQPALPTGLSLHGTHSSTTPNTIEFTITGNTTSHYSNFNNASIIFDPSLFSGTVPDTRTGNYSIIFYPQSFIQSDNNTFRESLITPGLITGTAIYTFSESILSIPSGSTLVLSTTNNAGHYALTDPLPQGLSFNAIRSNSISNAVEFTLTGTPTSHGASDSIASATITFDSSLFSANVPESLFTNFGITFFNDSTILFSDFDFQEHSIDHGAVTGLALYTVVSPSVLASTANSQLTSGSGYTVTIPLPSGLSVSASISDSTPNIIELSILGTASSHESLNNISNGFIELSESLFTSGNSPDNRNIPFSLSFYDASTISASGNIFTEIDATSGSVTGSALFSLSDSTISLSASSNLIEGTHFSLAGSLPSGLSLFAQVESTQSVSLTIQGNATSHSASDSIANLSLTFLDDLFSHNPPLETAPFSIIFYDLATIQSSNTTFNEGSSGSLSGMATITFVNSTLAPSTGDILNDSLFSISPDLPEGLSLTARVSNSSPNVVELSFSGSTSSHDASNSFSNSTVSFNSSLFLTNPPASPILSISGVFYDSSTIQSQDVNFSESSVLPGTALGKALYTFSNSTLALSLGDQLTADHFGIIQVPAGLTVSASVSDTTPNTVEVEFTGAAQNHNVNHSVTSNITFTQALFTYNPPQTLTTTYSISFTTTIPSLIQSNGNNFRESIVIDGSIAEHAYLTFTNSTFTVTSGSALSLSTHYTVNGLPEGLAVSASMSDTTPNTVEIELTGTATNHTQPDSVSSANIFFQPALFQSNAPDNRKASFTVDFLSNNLPLGKRFFHTSVHDSNNGFYVVVGTDEAGPSDEVWFSNDGIDWVQTHDGSDLPDRTVAGSIIDSYGNFYIVGGHNSSGQDEMYKSTDGGQSWSQITINDPTGVNIWDTTMLADTSGNIYLLAGNRGSDRVNEVWKSIDQGENWTEVSVSGDVFSARVYPVGFTDSNNNFYLIGGRDSSNVRKDDVWKSTDRGQTWTQVASGNRFSGRATFAAAIDSNDNIYVIGGDTTEGIKNDIWKSSDGGASWTEVAVTGEYFRARHRHTVTIDNNDNIYVIGGFPNVPGHTNSNGLDDIWKSSDDGQTWARLTPVLSTDTSALISATDSESSLTISNSTFEEVSTGSGQLSGTMTLDYANTGFNVNAGSTVGFSHYSVSPSLPSGLTLKAVVSTTDPTIIEVTILGTATNHNIGDSVPTTTLTLNSTLFSSNLPTDRMADFTINFKSTANIISSTYVFSETVSNNGAISGTALYEFEHSTLSLGLGTALTDTHVTIPSIPSGLSYSIQVSDTTSNIIELTFTGSASPNTTAQNISGGTITFKSALISQNPPADLTAPYSIQFLNDMGSIITSNTQFLESQVYDGQVSGKAYYTFESSVLNLSLGTSLTSGTHFSTSGIPSGLTSVATVSSITPNVVELTFTGTATGHADSDTTTASITFDPALVQFNIPPTDNRTSSFNISFVDNNHLPSGVRYYQVSPHDSNRGFYMVGGTGSGSSHVDDIWFSNDGVNWVEAHDGTDLPDRTVVGSTIDSNGNIYLIGGYYNENGHDEMYKSTDGGQSWSEITIESPNAINVWDNGMLSDSSGNIYIMAGVRGSSRVDHIWRSADQGVNWTRIIPTGTHFSARGYPVALTDSNDHFYVIGGLNSSNVGQNDVWKSMDRGQSWTQVAQGTRFEGRHLFGAAIDSNDHIYIIGGATGTTGVDTRQNDIWKSTDGGVNWSEITVTGEYFSPRHRHTLTIDSSDNLYILAGEDSTGGRDDIWKSTDGGQTWTRLQPTLSSDSSNLILATTATPATMTVSGTTGFNESSTDSAQLSGLQTLTFTNTSFVLNTGASLDSSHYTISPALASGLAVSASVSQSDSSVINFEISGTAAIHDYTATVPTSTLTLDHSVFGHNPPTNLSTTFSMTFVSSPLIYSYDTEFVETSANTGSFDTVALYEFDNTVLDLSTGTALTSGTHFTPPTNLPAGLTVNAEVSDTTANVVEVSLTGSTTPHTAASDINSLTISFEDALFQSNPPGDMTATFSITFFTTSSTLNAESAVFTESDTSDGSALGTALFSFTESTLALSTGSSLTNSHFSTSGLPSGLTAQLSVSSTTANVVELTFSGSASSHDSPVTPSITFKDALFSFNPPQDVTSTFSIAYEDKNLPLGNTHYHTSPHGNGGFYVVGSSGDNSRMDHVWFTTNGQDWVELHDDGNLPNRTVVGSVLDSHGNMYITGGWDSNGKNDMWKSTDGGQNWTQLSPSPSPTVWDHTMVADTSGNIYLLAGVRGGSQVDDIWRSADQGETWTEINPQGSHFPTLSYPFGLTDSNNNFYVIGGRNGGTRQDKVWKSTDRGQTWNQVASGTRFSPRQLFGAAIDSNDNIYVVGGHDGNRKNDVWKSTNGGVTWQQVSVTGTHFSARDRLSLTIDTNDHLYVIGGHDGNSRDDIWKSTDGGQTWKRLTVSTSTDVSALTAATAITPSTMTVTGNSFTETSTDSAQVTGTMTITLNDSSSFILDTGTSVATSHYTISPSLPSGLSLDAQISDTSSNVIEITLSGTANSHATSNSVSSTSITFKHTLFGHNPPANLAPTFSITFK